MLRQTGRSYLTFFDNAENWTLVSYNFHLTSSTARMCWPSYSLVKIINEVSIHMYFLPTDACFSDKFNYNFVAFSHVQIYSSPNISNLAISSSLSRRTKHTLTFQGNPLRWETAIVRAQFCVIITFLSDDVLLLCFSNLMGLTTFWTNFCYELWTLQVLWI